MGREESIAFGSGKDSCVVKIRRRKNQKHIRIRISGAGLITVSCPCHTPSAEVKRAVGIKEKWIRSHLSRIKNDIVETDPGQYIFLSGRKMAVSFICRPRYRRYRAVLDPESDQVIVSGPEEEREKIVGILRQRLEKEAREQLRALALSVSGELGIPIKKVFIRNQKSRWGSSSTGGNISLNWRVIMLPEELQRYLVIHELCHQVHLNHSFHYWKEVARHCPDYLELDRKLRNNRRLMALFR
jgi:predicted metal-dependent hydrolase